MFLQHSLWQILKKHWRLIFSAGLAVAVVAVLISIVFPLEYRADAQVLVIFKSRYGVDPYTASKTAERVGEDLSQIVKTNHFFNKVMEQSGYNLDKSRFENMTEIAKRKRWQKTIDVSVVYGTGVLNVSAYSPDKDQSVQLANATINALVNSGWEYTGSEVEIKIVNEPIATRWPARPNLPVNAILGFCIGIIAMSAGILNRNRV